MLRLFLLGIVGLIFSSSINGDVLKVGRTLPDVKLVLDGELVDLKGQVKGKTMMHIFASW